MTKLRFHIHDPVTVVTLETVESIISIIDAIRMSASDVDEQNELIGLGVEMNGFTLRCSNLFAHDPVTSHALPPEDQGLGYLLNHFADFTDLFSRTEELLELVIAKRDQSRYNAGEDWKLQRLRAIFNDLVERVERVTLTQLKLQLHFQHSWLFSPSRSQLEYEERSEFFSPLAVWRDRYFVQPRDEVLTEYLELAQALQNRPEYYSDRASKNPHERQRHRQTAESLATELEVFGMLEPR